MAFCIIRARVEVELLTNITQQNVKNFFWKNIVCRFGVPRVLVFDNRWQFDNTLFRDFCEHFGIQNHCSSLAHPQANGQAEVANRSLLKIIKTRLEGAKGVWPNELPSVLWAYRSMARWVTKCSMGAQADDENPYEGNSFQVSLWKRSSHTCRSAHG